MTTVQAVLDEIRDRPGTGDVIAVFDPSTEEQIAEFTDCGTEAVNAAVARAKASAESGVWSQKPDYERAKILWRVAELIDKNAELLAELEMLNGGMYPAQADMQVKIGSESVLVLSVSTGGGVAAPPLANRAAARAYTSCSSFSTSFPSGVLSRCGQLSSHAPK